MTLTEIEDRVVENFLQGIIGKERVLGTNISAYLSFLQATEIRRRLVGWQDPEKPAHCPVHVVCDEPIISTLQ